MKDDYSKCFCLRREGDIYDDVDYANGELSLYFGSILFFKKNAIKNLLLVVFKSLTFEHVFFADIYDNDTWNMYLDFDKITSNLEHVLWDRRDLPEYI